MYWRVLNNFEFCSSEEGGVKQYSSHVGGRRSTMCSLPEEVVGILQPFSAAHSPSCAGEFMVLIIGRYFMLKYIASKCIRKIVSHSNCLILIGFKISMPIFKHVFICSLPFSHRHLLNTILQRYHGFIL